MKLKAILPITLLVTALGAYGADSPTPPSADVVKPLEQVATEVQGLLVKDKIHNRFDLLRRLQKEGLTWQPALLAPNDLVGRLNDANLPFYAGVKLLDALYAATFMQRQAVAEAVQTIDAIDEKLNLRSFADASRAFLVTLKQAAAAPESGDVSRLMEQLAAAYVKDIPALMSNPETARYLLDSLYGMTIETGYLIGHLHRADHHGKHPVMQAVARPDTGIHEWMQTLINLFAAYGLSHETVQVGGQPIEKLALIRQILEARRRGDQSPEALRQTRNSVYEQALAIRTAMLTPAAQ